MRMENRQIERFVECMMQNDEAAARRILREYINEKATELYRKINEGRPDPLHSDETVGFKPDELGGMVAPEEDVFAGDIKLGSGMDVPILDDPEILNDPVEDGEFVRSYAAERGLETELYEKIDRSDKRKDFVDDVEAKEDEIDAEERFGDTDMKETKDFLLRRSIQKKRLMENEKEDDALEDAEEELGREMNTDGQNPEEGGGGDDKAYADPGQGVYGQEDGEAEEGDPAMGLDDGDGDPDQVDVSPDDVKARIEDAEKALDTTADAMKDLDDSVDELKKIFLATVGEEGGADEDLPSDPNDDPEEGAEGESEEEGNGSLERSAQATDKKSFFDLEDPNENEREGNQ